MVRTASSNDVYYIRFTFTFYRIHHHSQHVTPSRTVNTVIVSWTSSSFPTVVRSHGVGFSGEKELGGKFGRSRFLEVGRRYNQNEEGTRKEQQKGRGKGRIGERQRKIDGCERVAGVISLPGATAGVTTGWRGARGIKEQNERKRDEWRGEGKGRQGVRVL